jgi:hypothetical protein
MFRYRYSLQQLNDFSTRLIKRVEAADEWQHLLAATLESGQKICEYFNYKLRNHSIIRTRFNFTVLAPSDAKALLDSFHSQNLLECTEQMRLEHEVSGYRSLAAKAQRVLRPAVRLR